MVLAVPFSRKRSVDFLGSVIALCALSGCAAVGSMMSPYPEKFSCKNDDHGQCIHPERAYEDAVSGTVSKSDPRVTAGSEKRTSIPARPSANSADSYGSYRDSLYRKLKGLIDEPVTPMLKPARTIRTLILPYSDRSRPDRLYMPRYVYSILDRPTWVVGGTLVGTLGNSAPSPVLEQVKTVPGEEGSPQSAALSASASSDREQQR